MKKLLTEKNLVALLFCITLLVFTLAQRDADRVDAQVRDKADITTAPAADSATAFVPAAAQD